MMDGKFLPHVFELINFEGLHQSVQALRGELERVDELESVHSDGEILLRVLWNYPHLSEPTLQRFDNQVTIIVLEVMHDYGQLDYTYYVTMITHFGPSQLPVPYVTVGSSVDGAQLCIGKL